MEERVHLAGGRFEILSRPRIGTSIRARVRVAPERVADTPVLLRRASGGQ
jgi:signal transduction histidine kinase